MNVVQCQANPSPFVRELGNHFATQDPRSWLNAGSMVSSARWTQLGDRTPVARRMPVDRFDGIALAEERRRAPVLAVVVHDAVHTPAPGSAARPGQQDVDRVHPFEHIDALAVVADDASAAHGC